MDWSLIEQKLESLRRAASRAAEHCPEDRRWFRFVARTAHFLI